MPDREPDELDEEDLAAIDESEAQIARGEDLDWEEVSKELRQRYLRE
jgi:predicted transcriptional regulator